MQKHWCGNKACRLGQKYQHYSNLLNYSRHAHLPYNNKLKLYQHEKSHSYYWWGAVYRKPASWNGYINIWAIQHVAQLCSNLNQYNPAFCRGNSEIERCFSHFTLHPISISRYNWIYLRIFCRTSIWGQYLGNSFDIGISGANNHTCYYKLHFNYN